MATRTDSPRTAASGPVVAGPLAAADRSDDRCGHVELNAAIAEIQGWCREVGQLGRPRINELGVRLCQLRDLVCAHFACEERGGYLREVLCEVPELRHEAARLEAQHGELRRRFEELAAGLCSPEPTIKHWLAAVEQVQQLLTDVQTHEQQEGDLMLRALSREAGAAD